MSNPGFLVVVDGTTHPIHDNPTGLKAVFTLASGESCEVQISKRGTELYVVASGDVMTGGLDPRGHPTMVVAPWSETEARAAYGDR